MPKSLTLKIYRGDELVRTEQFARDIIKIGRLASAHLCLDEERISRIHSVIEVAPDGSLSIIDMGSADGTYVNGRRVNRCPLRPGDEIGLGGLRIILEVPGEEIAQQPAAATARQVDLAPEAEQPVYEPPAPAPAPKPAPAAAPARAAQQKKTRSAVDLNAVQLTPVKDEPRPAPQPRTVRAPAPAPEEESSSLDMGVELRLLWGDTLLDAGTFVKPAKPVLVGETKQCDFLLSGPSLPAPQFPILRYEEGEYRLLFSRGMAGGIEENRRVTPFATLVKERKATPDSAFEGAYGVAVPHSGAARADFGAGIHIEARFKKPPKPAVAPWWDRINYQFLNLFLLLLFLQGGFIVAANNFPYDTDTVADDLFKNPSRMAKFVLKPAEQLPKSNPYLDRLKKDLKRDQPGEAAERHKGTEGQMGKKDIPKTNARSAPRAIDPNAKDIVKNTGLLAALGRGRGATGGLSTVFGVGGTGGDLKGAIGNMFGSVVGDSGGLGGLGLKGSGTGGGGQGESIGIGAVGTKGRGGGLGGGSGYGAGVGNLGKKSDREVSVSTGPAAVLGSIDKELIRRVIQEHAAQIRYCYEQALAINPKLEGKVAIKWVINGDGRVSNAQVETGATTLDNGSVHQCMMNRISSWEFPKPKGGGMAVVTYPWILRPSGSAGG